MSEHNRVITCSCGETFESKEKFERHQSIKQRQRFNERAQEWLDDHVGGRLAEWHSEAQLKSYEAASHADEIDPDDPTDETVRDAAIQFIQDALHNGNVEMVFYDEFHD